MDTVEILETIEATPKGSARNEKLRELATSEIKLLLEYSLSPYITFGVKQLPEPKEVSPQFTNTEWCNVLFCLLNMLKNRVYTGNNAISHIERFLSGNDPIQRKWAERVIRQNLKLGIDAKTVNKMLPGTVPVFDVPLASKLDDIKDFAGPWVVQPKMDGGRCIAFMPANGGEVTLQSRNGKLWENFESIRTALQEWNSRLLLSEDCVLDGEVISYVNGRIDFQATQKTMHAKKRLTEIGQLEYVVFGFAKMKDWIAQNTIYADHLDDAEELFEKCNPPKNITLIRNICEVDDLNLELAKENAMALVEKGYEGAIYRRLNSPVRLKRTKDIVKVKLFDDDEAEIIGFLEGEEKYTGMLGALICKHKNGNTFKVGSGFSDKDRELIWQTQKDFLNKLCCFRFFRLTDDLIPYLPTFRGIRHPDDI